VLKVLGVAKSNTFSAVIAVQEYYRSGDPKRLDGLMGDIFGLQHQAAALRALTTDNPVELRRVDEIDRVIDRLVTLGPQLERLALTHSLAQVATRPEAAELSGGFEEMMRTLGAMTAEEDRVMRRQTEAARMASKRNVAAIATGSVMILWLLIIGFHAIRLSIRASENADDLAASREKLQKLNATLEQRVIERTAALFEQTNMITSIFESIPDGMMTITGDGIITSWNPGAERLFGYTAAEIIGESAGVLMAEGEQWLIDLGAEGENRRPAEIAEARRLRKDGTIIDLVVSTTTW